MSNNVIKEVTLVRLLDAPAAVVFKAWTNAAQLAKWWGPTGFTAPVCEANPVPGGKILIHMQAPDGWVNVITGYFEVVDEPNKLVLITRGFPDANGVEQVETHNTVIFEEVEGKTRLTLTGQLVKLSPELQPAADGMEEGWSLSLDKMAATVEDNANRSTTTSRLIKAPRQKVFEAFSNAGVLAKWWGPNGFTNTFSSFNFTPGGSWVFTMHGPNGKNFENHNAFVEIRPYHRIVIKHLSQPHVFVITVTLQEAEGNTLLTWHMVFEQLSEWELAKPYVIPLNEQNLDRLATQVE